MVGRFSPTSVLCPGDSRNGSKTHDNEAVFFGKPLTWVSMNFCLMFLICNSGHSLIRVIIKHNTMFCQHFFIFNYLLFVNLFAASVFLSPSKKKMTEASASVCLILATALLVHLNLGHKLNVRRLETLPERKVCDHI